MLSLKKLADEWRPHHNEVCMLFDLDIVRIVGVHEDDRDLYYRVRGLGRPGMDREWCATAVGWIYSLKGLLPQERYAQTDNLLTLNGCGPTAAFAVTSDLCNSTS